MAISRFGKVGGDLSRHLAAVRDGRFAAGLGHLPRTTGRSQTHEAMIGLLIRSPSTSFFSWRSTSHRLILTAGASS